MSERTLIALVDNEPGWVAALGRAIARQGYHTQLIGDADAALDMIESERPAVVILDRVLPRLDGLPLSRVLQEELTGSCPPLVLVTRGLDDVPATERERFEAAFEKPVEVRQLLQVVRRIARGQKRSGQVPSALVDEARAARSKIA